MIKEMTKEKINNPSKTLESIIKKEFKENGLSKKLLELPIDEAIKETIGLNKNQTIAYDNYRYLLESVEFVMDFNKISTLELPEEMDDNLPNMVIYLKVSGKEFSRLFIRVKKSVFSIQDSKTYIIELSYLGNEHIAHVYKFRFCPNKYPRLFGYPYSEFCKDCSICNVKTIDFTNKFTNDITKIDCCISGKNKTDCIFRNKYISAEDIIKLIYNAVSMYNNRNSKNKVYKEEGDVLLLSIKNKKKTVARKSGYIQLEHKSPRRHIRKAHDRVYKDGRVVHVKETVINGQNDKIIYEIN